MIQRKEYKLGKGYTKQEEDDLKKLVAKLSKEGNVDWEEVATEFNVLYPIVKRTAIALKLKCQKIMPSIKESKDINDRDGILRKGFLAELHAYDRENLSSYLEEREQKVLNFLKEEADLIMRFEAYHDALKKFDEYGIEHSLFEGLFKSLNVDTPTISDLEIIAVPGYGESKDKLSLLLPLYHDAIKNQSVRNRFSSRLYAAVVSVLEFNGFKNQNLENFYDLIRYNVIGRKTVDYENLGMLISEALQKEYLSSCVFISVDSPWLFNSKNN